MRISSDNPTGRPRRRILLVTGLSGAGKSSILRSLEDLGFQAVDNPPLAALAEIVAGGAEEGTREVARETGGDMAIGVDTRTSGFEPATLLASLERLRQQAGLQAELIYATADEAVLLRRYTATRRRHPMAAGGTVAEGIAAEQALMAPLRERADLVIDTSDLPAPDLRRLVERRFADDPLHAAPGLTLSLVSFAFPAGLPRDADMVLDARFLRNPFYDTTLSSGTGLDAPVAAFVSADPDYAPFLDRTLSLLRLVLPRFVTEGKKYATVAVGCSGGRHRSVTIVEDLARRLTDDIAAAGDRAEPQDRVQHLGDWSIILTHRELTRLGAVRPAAFGHGLTASLATEGASLSSGRMSTS